MEQPRKFPHGAAGEGSSSADDGLPIVSSVCLWASAILSIAAWTILLLAMIRVFGGPEN